ncbi:hypothetical protein H4O20_07055 [Aequorivita sp. 609]|uniref:hypothetical protein n=1 Tax=Aequorivita TaxID=153265 RepID=UPI00112236CC|nr:MULTISPECIES: hypothetical protein [Aequorivita]MBB6681199.1 hypothetical protein [Aequorivita sp. 609]
MRIEIINSEIIDLKEFELNWRWEKTHNPDISDLEKAQIEPVSEIESKRLNKVIDYFEIEDNLSNDFIETDWISASSENDEKIDTFRNKLTSILDTWDENVIVTWNRTTALKTTKEIFLKYWDDFCYPSSDDVTIISEETNWVMFYRHFEVANIWTRKK